MSRVPWFEALRVWLHFVVEVFYESFRHPLSTSYVSKPNRERGA